jgi:hypothetical protein
MAQLVSCRSTAAVEVARLGMSWQAQLRDPGVWISSYATLLLARIQSTGLYINLTSGWRRFVGAFDVMVVYH